VCVILHLCLLIQSINQSIQVLVDPVSRENFEKYGNPDGFQGSSYSIGLPSFLLEKENHVTVLVVYGLALVALQVAVAVWWTRSEKFSENGVLHNTMRHFKAHVAQKGGRFTYSALVDLLAQASEFVELVPRNGMQMDSRQQAELDRLARVIKDSIKSSVMLKKMAPWYYKSYILLHVYLYDYTSSIKEQSLAQDLEFILRKSHQLLDALVDVMFGWQQEYTGIATYHPDAVKGIQKPEVVEGIRKVIQLQQMMSHQLNFHDGLTWSHFPMRHLPHISESSLKQLVKKKSRLNNIRALRSMPSEERISLLFKKNEVPSKAEIEEIEDVLTVLPCIKLTGSFEIEGEEDQTVYCGDMVKLNVLFQRLSPEDGTDDNDTAGVEVDADDNKDSSAMDSKHSSSSVARNKKKKKKRRGDDDEEEEDDEDEETLTRGPVREEEWKASEKAKDPEDIFDTLEEDDPENLLWKGWNPHKQRRKRFDFQTERRIAYTPRFPSPVPECWYLLLIDIAQSKLVWIKRMPNPRQIEEIEIPRMIQVPDSDKAFTVRYRLVAACNSYIGCDEEVTIRLSAKARDPKDKFDADLDEEENGADATEEQHEEEEEWGPWYYLYMPTFWEFALNLFLMGLICVFSFNYLWAKGYIQPLLVYWDAYGAPVWAVSGAPVVNLIDSLIPQFVKDLFILLFSNNVVEHESDSYYDD
jgi:translocation protein SEC63